MSEDCPKCKTPMDLIIDEPESEIWGCGTCNGSLTVEKTITEVRTFTEKEMN